MQIYTHLLHGKLVCVDMPSGTLGPILSSLCTLASIQVDGCFGSTREVVPGLLWCNLAGEFCILSDRNRLCASAALHLECVQGRGEGTATRSVIAAARPALTPMWKRRVAVPIQTEGLEVWLPTSRTWINSIPSQKSCVPHCIKAG